MKIRAHPSMLSRQIEHYFNGRPIRFDLALCDLSLLTSFQQKVLAAEHEIPYGMVSTYRVLAQRIHAFHAARAVGRALACNPFPIIIPCHRTIRSDGSLGGFQGGVELKRRLLELEGVTFTPNGKVHAEWFY
jgi:methylated-DNA-[protein]-cysteine S-methyltransferase